MSFFSGSSGFTITGGTFNMNSPHLTTEETAQAIADAKLRQLLEKRKEPYSGEFAEDGPRRRCSSGPTTDIVDQLLERRKECKTTELDKDGPRKKRRYSSGNSDGLMIIKRDELDLRTELISRKNYRIHSASHGGPGGRVVAVKVFEGPRAKRDWTINVAFSKKYFHSNVLKVVGISEESSETLFVVFHGICEKRMQSMIAKALRTDLNTSVQLSMKVVKGLAAGLSYMKSQKFPLHSGARNINSQIWENFDILVGDNNEAIIAINLPSTANEDDSITESFDIASDGYGIEVLNGLCQKLFSEANSILYDDSPVREYDEYDEGLPTAAIEEDCEWTSINSEGGVTVSTPSNSKKKSRLSRTPRREVWWRRLNMGVSNRSGSLDAIARLFADRLDSILPSSFDSPLRRIRASKSGHSRRSSHQCPGYLREEIILTSDVSRSVIISHEYPSQSELCSACGQLVQYEQDIIDNVAAKPTSEGQQEQQEQRDQGSSLIEVPQFNTHYGEDDVNGRGQLSFPTVPAAPVSGGDRHLSVPSQQQHEQIQPFTFPGSFNSINTGGNNDNNSPSSDTMRQAVYNSPSIPLSRSQGHSLPGLGMDMGGSNAHNMGGGNGDDGLGNLCGLTMDLPGRGIGGSTIGGGLDVNGNPVANLNVANATAVRTANASSRRRKRAANIPCTIPGCTATFTRGFNLKGHLRSHYEEKPYKCHWSGCGKGFARQHDCKRHEQLHSNFRPFECEGCRKQFARMDALNRHLSEVGAGCLRADVAMEEDDGEEYWEEERPMVSPPPHNGEDQLLLTEIPQINALDGHEDVNGRGGQPSFRTMLAMPVSGGDRHRSVTSQHEQIQTFSFPGSSNNPNVGGNYNHNLPPLDLMWQAISDSPSDPESQGLGMEDIWLLPPGMAGPNASPGIRSVGLGLPSGTNGHGHSGSVSSLGVKWLSPYPSPNASPRVHYEELPEEEERVHGGWLGRSIGSLNAHNMGWMGMDDGNGSDGLGSLSGGNGHEHGGSVSSLGVKWLSPYPSPNASPRVHCEELPEEEESVHGGWLGRGIGNSNADNMGWMGMGDGNDGDGLGSLSGGNGHGHGGNVSSLFMAMGVSPYPSPNASPRVRHGELQEEEENVHVGLGLDMGIGGSNAHNMDWMGIGDGDDGDGLGNLSGGNVHEHGGSVSSLRMARRVSPYPSPNASPRVRYVELQEEEENVHGGLGMDMSMGGSNAHNMGWMGIGDGNGGDGLGTLNGRLTMDQPGGGGAIGGGLDANGNPGHQQTLGGLRSALQCCTVI